MHAGYDLATWASEEIPAELGGDFAYILLTRGGGGKNPYAPAQAKALRSLGKRVGFYHAVVPADSMADQLLNFETMASACGGSELPIAVYCDESDPVGWAHLGQALMAFAYHVESWTNYVPHPRSVLYVTSEFRDALAPYGFPWNRWVWLNNPGADPSASCLIFQPVPRPVPDLSWPSAEFRGTDDEWARFIGERP